MMLKCQNKLIAVLYLQYVQNYEIGTFYTKNTPISTILPELADDKIIFPLALYKSLPLYKTTKRGRDNLTHPPVHSERFHKIGTFWSNDQNATVL